MRNKCTSGEDVTERQECPGPDNCVESKTSNGCLGCPLSSDMSEKEEHTPTVDCHKCPIMRICGVRDPRASLNLEAYEGHIISDCAIKALDKDYEKMKEVTTRCPLAQRKCIIHDAMKAEPAEG